MTTSLTPLSRDVVFRRFRKEKRQLLNSRIPSFRNIRVPEVFDHIEIEASCGDFIKISLDSIHTHSYFLLKWRRSEETQVKKYINGKVQSVWQSISRPWLLMENFVNWKLNKSGNLIKNLKGNGWFIEVLNRMKPLATIERLRIIDRGGNDMFWIDKCFEEVEVEEEEEEEGQDEVDHDDEEYDFDDLMLPSCSLNSEVLPGFRRLQCLEYYSETVNPKVLEDINKLNLHELRLAVSSLPDSPLNLSSRLLHVRERKHSFNRFLEFAKKLRSGTFQPGTGYGLCETDDMSTDQFFERIQQEFPTARRALEATEGPLEEMDTMKLLLSTKTALFFYVSDGFRVKLLEIKG